MSTNQPVLVIGASGKTGRRVADRLESAGVPVRRAGRRGPTPFDWAERGGWTEALSGCRAAYVAYSPDLATEQAAADIRAFMALAEELQVGRTVLLSGRGEPAARRCEQIVLESGTDATVIRASWFAQNFDEGAFLPMVLDGTIALPVGERREPFIDVEDLAEVALMALTEDGHSGEIYEITGPRLMTFTEATAELAEATGRELRFETIDVPAFRSGLTEAGLEPEFIELLVELFAKTMDGRNESVTNGVERVLGRPARDFRDYARRVAAQGPLAARSGATPPSD